MQSGSEGKNHMRSSEKWPGALAVQEDTPERPRHLVGELVEGLHLEAHGIRKLERKCRRRVTSNGNLAAEAPQRLVSALQLLHFTGVGSVALRKVSRCHTAQLFDRTPLRVQSQRETRLLMYL